MSDFHRSLERALEQDPHTDWGFGAREVMAAELGIHSAYPPPAVDRSFVDAFPGLAAQELPSEGQE